MSRTEIAQRPPERSHDGEGDCENCGHAGFLHYAGPKGLCVGTNGSTTGSSRDNRCQCHGWHHAPASNAEPPVADEKNPLHKALADLALRGGLDETIPRLLALLDERYERRGPGIREPATGCQWGVYKVPRLATGQACWSVRLESGTIEQAIADCRTMVDNEPELAEWAYEVREVLPDGSPGAFGPSVHQHQTRAPESGGGEPTPGSRLWRCEQELARARENVVEMRRWRAEITRAVASLYAREADGYYRVAKGTLDTLFALFSLGSSPEASVQEQLAEDYPAEKVRAYMADMPTERDDPPPRDIWKTRYREAPARGDVAVHYVHASVVEELQRERDKAVRELDQFVHISSAEAERCVEIGWDHAKQSAADLLRLPNTLLPSGGQNARLRDGLAEMVLAMRSRHDGPETDEVVGDGEWGLYCTRVEVPRLGWVRSAVGGGRRAMSGGQARAEAAAWSRQTGHVVLLYEARRLKETS